MGQHGGPTCGESGRNAWLEDDWCLSGSGSCQVVDEGCGLLAPSAPPLLLVRPNFIVGCFFLCFCGHPVERPLRTFLLVIWTRHLEWGVRQWWRPRQARLHSIAGGCGRPLAMTSIRRSSCWWRWLMLRSLTLVLVVTRAPASRHMRAVAPSSGYRRLRRIPDSAQAARWLPWGFRMRRHRQVREVKGSGSRRRRRRITLKRCGG